VFIHHNLPLGDPDWALLTNLPDLFPIAVEVINAYLEHQLFVTELQHPLDDPLSGSPVIDPERIFESIISRFVTGEPTPQDIIKGGTEQLKE
jgi:hypothetical protein